jgi:predicted RNase H-like HicB family nuclease
MMIDTALKPATYTISVQQQPNGQWLAQVLGWTDCHVKAPSREAAIAEIEQTLNEKLTAMDRTSCSSTYRLSKSNTRG